MFDCLFVPLSYFYMISMAALAVILPREIVSILRSPKEHWALIVCIIGFVGGSCIFLFAPTEYAMATTLKRQVLDGRVFGYISFFCAGPFFYFAILMTLPSERRRARR